MSDFSVRDNRAMNRFEADVQGQIAITAYRHNKGIVTFTHTEVPESLRGHGVAGKLVRGALDQVRARGEHVVPECPYVASFIQKHPEYQDLVHQA